MKKRVKISSRPIRTARKLEIQADKLRKLDLKYQIEGQFQKGRKKKIKKLHYSEITWAIGYIINGISNTGIGRDIIKEALKNVPRK